MPTKIGASIALEGESEFRKAISNINAGLKVTASELTLVTAKFSDNSKSVEALTSRNAVLQNQINGQTEKIKTLRDALANSISKYGEADKKTLQWKISLNNAETELVKMQQELSKGEKELVDFSKAQDESTEKGKTLGTTLNDLIGTLGINLPAGAENAIKALDGQKVSTLALIGVTAGLVTGFAKLTIETAKTARGITNLSRTTGMSVESYQEWDYVLKGLGYSMEQASGDLSQMAEKAMDAAKGAGEGAELFGKLGVKVTENNGQLKDQGKLFDEIVLKLQGMRNETERNAIASALLGTSGEKLIPILSMNAKELDNMKQQARDMGYVMDENTIKSFNKLGDSMQQFSAQKEAFKNTLAVVMLPLLTSLFEILNKIDPKILATVTIIGSIAIIAVTVVKAIGSITNTFSMMNPAVLKTTAIVVGVTAALIALAAIIAVILNKSDDLDRAMYNIGNSVGNMTSTVNGAKYQIGSNATGTSNWRGGLTWINEDGPELIDLPSGTKIYNNRRSMQMISQASQPSEVYNLYGDVIIPAKDIKEMQDVTDFFRRFKRVARQEV